jgi:NodT family efflux transporter outer membrane factor (OMF) lipoprotein
MKPRALLWLAVAATLALLPAGCTPPGEYVRNGFKVGPNYQQPPAAVADKWIDAGNPHVRYTEEELSQWWKLFNDPVLDDLICEAYRQNLTLRQAGERILEARAQLGIAIGTFFPQQQFMTGSYQREQVSTETATRAVGTVKRFFSQWTYGFTLTWELDFWGRFRRMIESADATLDASVAGYDAALVTLLGDVATTYVQIRTLEKRIEYAEQNVKIQEQIYKITKDKAGGKQGLLVSGIDLEQALSTFKQTEAGIPDLRIALRQAENNLCLLLGIPMVDLRARLGKGRIPTAPPDVVIGIPADLLRRRPDIREAERTAAAQSAQIGVAESAFYPHISFQGTIDYQAARFKDLFNARAMSGSVGPTFQWEILNYGRLLFNVRDQEAHFRELVVAYQQTVLSANKEVEDGLVMFLEAQQKTRLQQEATDAGLKAFQAVKALWDNGNLTDFTRVAQLEQTVVVLQDTLAQARGEIALGLIMVYRAMGGGWQLRCTGCEAAPVTAAETPRATLGEPLPAPRRLNE